MLLIESRKRTKELTLRDYSADASRWDECHRLGISSLIREQNSGLESIDVVVVD